jgi:hypothetical protein
MGFRREMQNAIGRQLRVECELPQESAPKITALLARMDEALQERTPTHRLAVEVVPVSDGWRQRQFVLTKNCASSQPNPEAVIGV